MAIRTFEQCAFDYKDLSDKEDELLVQILDLSMAVDYAAAVGTDEEFAEAKTKLAMAEARLDEVLKAQAEVDLDFDAYFQDAA